MEERADDEDVANVCPSCRHRRTVLEQLRHPAVQGAIVTSVVIGGARTEDASDLPWTVMIRRGTNLVSIAKGRTEEDAIFDALRELGVVG